MCVTSPSASEGLGRLTNARMSGRLVGMADPGRAQSALNLRLVLASFGLACTAVLAFLAIWHHNLALAVFCCVLASITITDIVVITVRRRRRRRREHGSPHSLFE